MFTLVREKSELLEGLRVIVVDDVLDCKDLVEMYLMQNKALVRAVDSAKDALKTIDNFQPDLIISDIYMPEEDGYWLIEQVNQLNTNSDDYICAIALTAAATKEEQEALIAAGYDAYLTKPFMFEDLTASISQVIGRAKIVKSSHQ